MNGNIPSWFASQWQVCAMKFAGAWRVQRARRWRHYYQPRDHWTFLQAGDGCLRIAQSSWRTELSRGAGLVLPAGRAFDVEVAGTQADYLIADFRVLPAFGRVDPLTLVGLPVAVPDVASAHSAQALHWFAANQPLRARACFELCLLDYLAAGFAAGLLSEKPTLQAPDWLVAARNHIVLNFMEPLDLARLAARVGVSPAHLSHGFRRAFDATPIEFLYEERLTQAARFLTVDRDASIGEIAHRCGFPDQGHFTRRFRRRYKVTPTRWRRRVPANG